MAHQVMLTVTQQGDDYIFTPHSGLWRRDPALPAGGKFVFHKGDHGMHKQDWHFIEFWLHPKKNAGLKFASPMEDAMWVIRPRPGHTCPDASDVSAGNIDYSVMGPLERNSNSKLTAYNSNMTEEEWSFALNFEDSSGRPVSWDPIGDNQDAGHSLISSNWLTYAAIAIGAGLVSAVATVIGFRLF